MTEQKKTSLPTDLPSKDVDAVFDDFKGSLEREVEKCASGLYNRRGFLGQLLAAGTVALAGTKIASAESCCPEHPGDCDDCEACDTGCDSCQEACDTGCNGGCITGCQGCQTGCQTGCLYACQSGDTE